MKKKSKGGKRDGAGRKPSEVKKEPITIYTDVSRFGGKDETRSAIYEFLDTIPAKVHTKVKKPPLKPKEQSKDNITPDSRPKTLDELKKLCPTNLEGLERSSWISKERQKYGI